MRAQIKEAAKLPAEKALSALEQVLISRESEPTFRPIFIVAPARSGSTLIYQAMARYFELCYFSNSMGRFPASPVCMARLLAPLGGCNPPDGFRSRRGLIEGGRGPSDGTKIWARWFRHSPQYIPNGVLTPAQRREVRTTIALFQEAFGVPFINKTQRNCGRILALAEIFPEAIFLRVHRDPFAMVRSRWQIYQSRDDENRLWQSYRPSNSETIITDDPIEHLCQQVLFTEAEIDRDRRKLGSRGFFDLSYEDFCRRPVDVLEEFANYYRGGAEEQQLRRRHDIPSSFESGNRKEIAPVEREAIRRGLSQSSEAVTAGMAGAERREGGYRAVEKREL